MTIRWKLLSLIGYFGFLGTAVLAGNHAVFEDFDGSMVTWSGTGSFVRMETLEGMPDAGRPVTGYSGRFFATNYDGKFSDRKTGTLLSKVFKPECAYINFKIAGGNYPATALIELLYEDRVLYSATGKEDQHLRWESWNVKNYRRENYTNAFRIRIRDEEDGPWGWIAVDEIEFSDTPRTEIYTGGFFKIYDPSVGETNAWYINDHCFVQGADGTWHLFGITKEEPRDSMDEVFFAHATAPDLLGPWTKQEPVIHADRANGSEYHVWAPHVIEHEGLYYMFYCGGDPVSGRASNTDEKGYRINLAISTDLYHWKKHPGNPLFKDAGAARDPMVFRHEDEWLMYYTVNRNNENPHTVALRRSKDLVNWSEDSRTVFNDQETIGASHTESPFVFKSNGEFYLLIGPRGGYAGTDVFRSKTPFEWKCEDWVGWVPAHAAELILNGDNLWVSSCGWGQRGVYLAPLHIHPIIGSYKK